MLATLRRKDGTLVPGHQILIVSSRAGDKVVASGKTDDKGEMKITLDSRLPGPLELSTKTDNISLVPYKILLREAWFEAKFKITGYNVCLEDDFNGELTDGKGLAEKHKSDLSLQCGRHSHAGTGMASNGKLIGLKRLDANWHRNAKGNRDYIEDRNGVTFQYLTRYGGKWRAVQEDRSIAVDPKKIPPLSKVNIESVGDRFADDTGSMIIGHHIDNFLGAGKEVVALWLKGGVNGTHRNVKFLGYEP